MKQQNKNTPHFTSRTYPRPGYPFEMTRLAAAAARRPPPSPAACSRFLALLCVGLVVLAPAPSVAAALDARPDSDAGEPMCGADDAPYLGVDSTSGRLIVHGGTADWVDIYAKLSINE